MAVEKTKAWVFEVDPTQKKPTAIILPAQFETVVGAIIRLDFDSSFDPDGNPLTYTPRFVVKPIGSQVDVFGFRNLEADGSIVSFSPDVSGHYQVGLTVNNGSVDSDEAFSEIDVKLILTPQDKGIVPDARFIWNFLSDFWTLVHGRGRFESFWSALIQIVGGELLRVWQVDYGKSIRDIQDLFQERWLHYTTYLELDAEKTTFILADDQAGLNASTLALDSVSGIVDADPPAQSININVPVGEGNFVLTSYNLAILAGRVIRIANRGFTMARSGTMVSSVNYGAEGHSFVPAGGESDFLGSGFDASHMGMVLRILSGPEQGSFLISSFIDQTHIKVTALSGGDPVLTEQTGLLYSVISNVPTLSTFFANRPVVPTQLHQQAWRFSSTLVSSEYDLEAQGVCVGDTLEVEISRTDTSLNSTVRGQVTAVDRNRIGFVFNVEDLMDGVAAGGFTDETQLKLADELRVSGLLVTSAATLFYTEDALQIYQTVNSIAFRRTYYEKRLTPTDPINVGPFNILARPVRIIRNSCMAVHEDLISVPTLQEYIQSPQLATIGTELVQISDNNRFPIDHEPYILFENLDYVLDDESIIRGACDLTAGSDVLHLRSGDLIDRSVAEGDTLDVSVGVFFETFTILRVLNSEDIRVTPVPTLTASAAAYKLTRRLKGKFIRFIPGTFSKERPAPERLWGEVSFFDNNDYIEENFGTLVGISQDDLERQNAVTPYRNSVAGLMFVLTGGPTVANLQLAANILLGLPFTLNPGFITDINPNYRLREDGSPLLGRIVISVTDRRQTPLGVLNVFFYPQGRFVEDPDNPGEFLEATPGFSGLGVNPETGETFQVGDFVPAFTPLAAGVILEDYLTSAGWFDQLVSQGEVGVSLQQYHSFRITTNADIVAAGDTILMARFLQGAKAHYTRLRVNLLRSLEDFIRIEDDIIFSFAMPPLWSEIPGLSLPRSPNAGDELAQLHYLSEGIMYSWYLSGEDLVTTQNVGNPGVVTSAIGGFINPVVGSGQSHDTPFIAPGDRLTIRGGPNAGNYTVTSVNNDNELELDMDDGAGFIRTFQTLASQRYRLFRPIVNPIVMGIIDVTNGSNVVELISSTSGLFSSGLAVDDVMVYYPELSVAAGVSKARRISAIDYANSLITMTEAATEVSGSYTMYGFREPILTRYLGVPGSFATWFTHSADFVSGNNFVSLNVASIDRKWAGLIRPGDVITPIAAGVFEEGEKAFYVLDWSPDTYTAYVTPAPDFTATHGIRVLRNTQGFTPIGADLFDKGVHREYFELLFNSAGQDLLTTAASDTVSTVSGEDFGVLQVLPGDYLVVREGADAAIDVGHGPGVYTIREVSGTQLMLVDALTVTNNAPGILYGILRMIPNEG